MQITFGEYMRGKRLSQKMTLRNFSKLVDISPSFVSALENDDKPAPSDDTLKKIAVVLKLDVVDTRQFYDLAAQTKTANQLPVDITEIVKGNQTVRIALRVAKDLDATDEEWEDFMSRLKAKQRRDVDAKNL